MDNRLKLILKVAAILLTAPATIEVAAAAYPTNMLFRVMVTAGMLVVVEGALLLGWHKLDTDTTATPAQRWLYAAIAMVAYVVLWLVAIGHHEGGLVWGRATLGVLLIYSIAESGILADVRINTEDANNIAKDLFVRMHDRKLARAEAKAEREAMNAVRLAFLSAEQSGGLHAATKYRERLQEQIDVTHDTYTGSSHEPSHAMIMPSKWDRWVDPRELAKDDTKTAIAAMLEADPNISTYRLAKELDRSEKTVRKYRQELEVESALVSANGHGALVPN